MDNWYKFRDKKPLPQVPVLMYNKNWIHPLYNPKGVREGVYHGTDDMILACYWDDYRKHTYVVRFYAHSPDLPTHWTDIPSGPKEETV